MGTWAEGNFDNDGALDYVGDLTDELAQKIENCFENETASLDEDGESILMPSIEILAILHEQCHSAPPKPDQIQNWKARYLDIFEEEIDGLDPDGEFKIKRRKVIDDTFDRLLRASKTFWKQT